MRVKLGSVSSGECAEHALRHLSERLPERRGSAGG
jgi:hypothetical protein